MSCYYFAYGSNMNPERMNLRAMNYRRILSGRIAGLSLAFNKRAADAPWRSYANVVHDAAGCVEGLLYELDSDTEIFTMDPFEGVPRLYSREIFTVATEEGGIPAWVYVANRAMIEEGLLPERWYLDHLLAGERWLSESYFRKLKSTPCQENS